MLKTVYSTGEYWEFGGITYKNGQPYQMAVPEGRAVYTGGAWQYEFFYTDHLGNTRVAFRANGNQLVKTSETAFDAFGLVLRGAGQVNGYQNRFEYQNKEKESTFGLNRINLGSRTYNPTTGRMDGVDALADIMRRHSPYQANFNNPLRFLDPDGNEAQDFTYNDGYGAMSSRNSSGSVGFSGSYQNSGQDGCPPNCTDNKEPIKGGFPNSTLQPASQQNATVSESKTSVSSIDEAGQLGVNIAWTIESGLGLAKSGLSIIKNGFKVAKTWFEIGETAKISKEVWNLGEAVITKTHHNWSSIFGNKTITLSDVEPIVKTAVQNGQWKTTGVINQRIGRNIEAIGDKMELIQEVNGHNIWVGGMKEYSTGRIIINNAAVK